MPYIEDEGQVIADSGFILDYLKATYGDPLDSRLTAQERAVALGFRRLLEENLYWVAVYSRWMEPQGWTLTKRAFFAGMPAPHKWFVPELARRILKREMHGHGIGRHRRDEIYAIGCADVSALADFLGSKPCFMGDASTSLDAVAYAFLANLLWVPVDSPLKAHALQFPNLDAYCRRMKAAYW